MNLNKIRLACLRSWDWWDYMRVVNEEPLKSWAIFNRDKAGYQFLARWDLMGEK